MELKLPPPLIWLICALLIWLTASLFPSFSFPCHRMLSLLILFCALFIAALSIFSFYLAKTTVSPAKPEKTTALLQHGIFRFSRNPMYLSLALMLLALTCWLTNAVGFLIILLFAGYITRFQIIPEEKVLAGKFGQQYIDYCGQVRRWI